MEGWITLNREVRNHWVYSDAETFRAWVTILMEVNHSDQKVMVGKTIFSCARGESLRSLESWGKLFGNWSKSRTKRFFDMLKSETMICIKSERITTRLSVCNYDKYQDSRNANETRTERKRVTNNNEYNEYNEKKNTPTAMADKPADEAFEKFWDYYGKKGNKQKSLSMWKKLTEKNKGEIRANIKTYIESTPELKYRKNAEVYLNPKNEHWNDEVVAGSAGDAGVNRGAVTKVPTGVFA